MAGHPFPKLLAAPLQVLVASSLCSFAQAVPSAWEAHSSFFLQILPILSLSWGFISLRFFSEAPDWKLCVPRSPAVSIPLSLAGKGGPREQHLAWCHGNVALQMQSFLSDLKPNVELLAVHKVWKKSWGATAGMLLGSSFCSSCGPWKGFLMGGRNLPSWKFSTLWLQPAGSNSHLKAEILLLVPRISLSGTIGTQFLLFSLSFVNVPRTEHNVPSHGWLSWGTVKILVHGFQTQ